LHYLIIKILASPPIVSRMRLRVHGAVIKKPDTK
jgi:hypothetical protein